MRKFHFAAIAALAVSAGLGSAYAAQAGAAQAGQQHNGFTTTPAYSDDALGGA